MAEGVGICSPTRRVPGSQFQRTFLLRGPAPFWLVLGVPTFQRPVLATASHGPCHSGPNKVVAPFYTNTMSRKRHLFTAMELYGSVVQLARHCPLANDPSASVAPSYGGGGGV